MAYKSIYHDVVFIEGEDVQASKKTKIFYKKTIYNQQLKTLFDVKAQLAEKAKELGCNAVVCFEYGQKSSNWVFSLLLSLDDNVDWYGEGYAATISQEYFNEIALQCNL